MTRIPNRAKKNENRRRDSIANSRHLSHPNGNTMENAIARVALEHSRVGTALQNLTVKLMEAQEEERRRIGRELHDGLNQQLAMLVVELGLLARQVPARNTTLIESVLNLRQRAECLSDDLRQISHQLHPAVLEHLGLHSALRSLCSDFTRQSGIRAWLRFDENAECVPQDIAICLYRITQEGLRNVAKHSGAKETWIRISRNADELQFSITDKGVGFDIRSTAKAGLGLISMEERVRIIQGHFSIESASNAGTAIRITVPGTWKEQ